MTSYDLDDWNLNPCRNRLFQRFQVLMMVNMNITIFWDVRPCSLLHGIISQKTVVFRKFFLHCCIQFRFESHQFSYPWIVVDLFSVGKVARAWNWLTTVFSWLLRLRMHQVMCSLPCLSSWDQHVYLMKADNSSFVTSKLHSFITLAVDKA